MEALSDLKQSDSEDVPWTQTKVRKSLPLRYLEFVLDIRKLDVKGFAKRHTELYTEAQRTKDYSKVTQAYYGLMSSIIEKAYGTSLHFCPPDFLGQAMDDSIVSMHHRVARLLQLAPGKKCLDIGCGIGGMMRDVARFSGCQVTGITLGHNEVQMNNHFCKAEKLEMLCHPVQGDFYEMNLPPNYFDSSYAVYALKYFIDLTPVFKNVYRVLKPGGLMLVYDIVKTPKYDPKNEEHREIVEGFEYACGMPPLHSNQEMIDMARRVGLECVSHIDLSNRYPWYYYFTESGGLNFILNSEIIDMLIRFAVSVRILPEGFDEFNNIFIKGTVQKIVNSGKLDILSGSNILIFQKE